MTINDDNSIFVGGLSYEVSEDTLRRVFEIYGVVLAVKINNRRPSGGSCYGFVTFGNPRSAANAIREINGQQIYGRVVRVDEVRRRERPDFNREYPRREFSYDGQRHRDLHGERFQDYGRENRQFVDFDRFEEGSGHRGDVEQRHYRERDWEIEGSFKNVDPRSSSRQRSVDMNSHHQMKDGSSRQRSVDKNSHQMKDHRYSDGDQFHNGPRGDAEQARGTKRGRDWERQRSFNRGEPRNNDRDKSLDRNNHHQTNDHQHLGEDQFNNGPNGDVEYGHVTKHKHGRERESSLSSAETRNNSRQKSLDTNSHLQMKDNRYVGRDQFEEGPKDDVEPVRSRKHERDWESDSSFNSEEPSDDSRQRSVDRENQPSNRSVHSDDRSTGPSVESINDDQDQEQIGTKLAKTVKLRDEISHMEDDAADKEEEVSKLQEKCQKLDDSSKAAAKLPSDRHMQLEKLFKCYLQVKDCEKKLKQAEEELQLLVDATRTEFEVDEC